MKKRMYAVLMLAALLAACSTEYHPKNSEGGYSEVALSPGVWRVSIDYTASTMPTTVADFLLLRSAELTLQQGYSQFALMDANGASAVVHMFKTPEQNQVKLHDARIVCSRLGAKYEVTCL